MDPALIYLLLIIELLIYKTILNLMEYIRYTYSDVTVQDKRRGQNNEGSPDFIFTEWRYRKRKNNCFNYIYLPISLLVMFFLHTTEFT